ncbi:uncharacterized protein LOC117336230 [Pecten maximus]|uniref:uncharacterized protein LOC117336230 n=1 Tax=Pecten maximus TaxID=6579 RepID=UPI001458210D|nr:uncharacterized protein LOC117336230 [Pecten maximus]
MKDLFFLLLVVFSLWTIISGAVTVRQEGQWSSPVRKKVASQQIGNPAISFSASKSKSNCAKQPKCAPDQKSEIKKYSAGGCPIIRCVKRQMKCSKPVCRQNQRVFYSGKKLTNGCQEITCKNIRAPRRRQRQRKGPCPSVASCKSLPKKDGYCEVPRNIVVRGRRCPVCPELIPCNKQQPKMNCPDLRRCPKANFKSGQCVIPSKNEQGGCQKCPIITNKCNQVGGVRNNLG